MYMNQNQYYNQGGYTGQTTQGYTFDPRVGNGSLPPGFQGTANRAYTRQVQPNELSQNQITGLLSRADPYIANARQRGEEFSAGRGLLNSSAAAGASERAAIEAAAPLAMQDAQMYGTAAGQNLDALNQMALQQLQASTQRGIASSNSAAAAAAAEAQRRAALQLQREQLAFSGEQNQLDRGQQWGMQNLNLLGQNWLGNQNLGRQNWLADQDVGRAMQTASYGTALGLYGQGMQNLINLPNQMFASGLIGSDYFANPQELSNFFGGFYSSYQPLLSGVFNNLFSDLGFGG